MAGKNRRSSTDLKTGLSENKAHATQSDLIANGPAYAYFQAIRLLRQRLHAASGQNVAADERIRVRPSLDLAFPAADIEKIATVKKGDQTCYHVTANFLGLYGTSSPLPTFYSEDLIDEAGQDESVSRDFIDIIHQRLYALLFQGWLKYKQFFQVAEEKSAPYVERLYCLLGLGADALREEIPDSDRLLRYIGLFTQFPRSAAGLLTLLKDSLAGVPIALIPCVKRMAVIPESQRLKTGITGSVLGVDTYMGEEIEDRMGKFRVQIGPLTRSDFSRFTPGKPDYNKLVALTELYLTEPFEYEIELILKQNQAQTICLGNPDRSALGVSGWVFSESTLGEVCTRLAGTRA